MSTTQTAITPTANKRPVAPTAGWLEMSKEERAAWLRENGKGFLSPEERAAQLRTFYNDIEHVYLAEARKAHEARDHAAFWQWYSLTEAPAHSLQSLKRWRGADFIRELGFDTTEADAVYGAAWLEE